MRRWILTTCVLAASGAAALAADTLTLNAVNATGGKRYLRPGDTLVVDLDVSDLQQMVSACQALMGYNSTYLNAGSVAPGGGAWTELIYESWAVPDELDTAIGVTLEGPVMGTQEDGTVAIITLTARNTNGVTRMVFRPDGPGDYMTMLATLAHLPVIPAKVNSQDIVIDGTPPVVTISSATQNSAELLIENGSFTYATPGTVNITVTTVDAPAGVGTPPTVTVTPLGQPAETAAFVNEAPVGSFHYAWAVTTSTPNGQATIQATATDRCGNTGTAAPAHFIAQNHSPAPDTLTLNAVNTIGGTLYVRPGTHVLIDMDVSNLQQMVNGCQALLGYSSTYLQAGSVAPGDPLVWAELIYESWAVPGELDTAIGVRLNGGPVGTQDDGTVAIITLTAGNTEGTTRMIFRPDGESEYATLLSTLTHQAVYPTRVNSQNVVIDGTPPVAFTVTTDETCTTGAVTLTFGTTDSLSGVNYYELFVDNASIGHVTSPYVLSLAGYADGGHSIYVKAFDKAGNSTSTPAITVNKDTTGPVISGCPANITQPADAAKCDTVVTWTAPAAVDGCSVASLTSNHNPGETFSVGATTVTYTATDGLGNTSTCSFTVTVTDTQKPVLVGCPIQNITKPADPESCSTTVSWTAPTASDNCGTPTLTPSHNPGASFPVGTTAVTYAATDASGNSTMCGFNVIITDTQSPTITCPADVTVNADAGSCVATDVNLGTPMITDNCPGAVATHNHPSSTYAKGPTTVTWTVTDASGNTASCDQTVTVLDNQPPTITTCGASATANASASCQAAVPNMTADVTATDNCTATAALLITQSPTAGTLLNKGVNNVTITVTDEAGQSATCTKTYTVFDVTPPVITLNGASEIQLQCHQAYVEQNATVTDNCDTGLTAILSGDTVDPGNPRTYTIKYDAVDSSGNHATQVTRTVVVQEANPTIGNLPQDLTVECTGGGGTPKTNPAIQAFLAAPVVVDGCDTDASLGNDAPAFFPVGTTEVTWTAADPDTQTPITASRNVTVNDTTPPTIACPADVAVNTDAGVCQATNVAIGQATGSDVCDGVTITSDHASTTYPKGVTTVTWTATDDANLIATCTQTVTVSDPEKPVITGCPANIAKNADAGLCTAVVSWIPPTVSDNCGATLSSNYNPGDAFAKGTTTVVYTAADDAGNQADACSFTVTVTDAQAPTIATCPATRTIAADANCSAAIPDLVAETVASDNCPGVTITQSPVAGTLAGLGDTTVTITATDAVGRTATCTVVVTVADQTPPTVACKNISVNLNAAGQASIAPADVYAGGSDNCGTVSPVSAVPSTFTCANRGANTVTLTVSDGHGNNAACDATVTVVDNTPPVVAVWPADRAIDAGTGCDVSVPDLTGEVQASDNCSYTVTQSPTAGSTISGLSPHTVTVTVTDPAGSSVSHTVTLTITESTAPTIGAITATQAGVSVICPADAAQGTVDIYATVTHVGCATLVQPTVSVVGIGPATFVDKAGDVFHYRVTIAATTANGPHAITVTAADSLGNTATDSSQSICVNKNQITGRVEFDSYTTSAYQVTRNVVFTATDTGGTVLATRPQAVTFTNIAATKMASGLYTVPHVPAGTAHLSAKTAWSLRRRVNVAFDDNGQAVAGFTQAAGTYLPGGDLDGSNFVNILDYSILRTNWTLIGAGNPADINGDSVVNLLDYSIIKSYWFVNGDAK